MKFNRLFATLALGALTSVGAHAAVIDFDAHPSDFGTPIFDSGFTFDFTASGWGVFGPGSGACCDVNYNGTTSMFADGDRDGSKATIVMTPTAGGTFAISSLDAAVYWTGASGSIDVIGNLNGGGTVSTTLTVGTVWESFALVGFNNLDSVMFRDTASGAFLSAPGMGIDNINTTPVPEPETYALMIGGLGLLALVRRRAVKHQD